MLSRETLLRAFVLICWCFCLILTAKNRNGLQQVNPSLWPRHIRIAYGNTPEIIVIMWSTEDDANGTVEVTQHNEGHSSMQLFSKTFPATSAKLEKDNKLALKFYHRAEVKGLFSGEKYKYRVKTFTSTNNTETEPFNISMPDFKGELTFLVLADMGTSSKSIEFVRHEAVNRPYSAVFHIGDIAYNLNTMSGSTGDTYLERISPEFTAYVPYMLTPGDHESFDGFYHYTHRFSMPQSSWPMDPEKLWYSIDVGFTHFISIDTEAFFRGQEQRSQLLSWLEMDLVQANKNRRRVPWIIVMGHKPIYCAASVMEQECHKEYSVVRDSLEDVFYVHGVDLYISGHKHVYERTWPMYRGRAFNTDTIDPLATIYLIIGAMGYEYLTDDSHGTHPFWLAFSHSDRDKELYARLQVTNSSHLTWQVVVAETNAEIEKVHIIQRKHGSFGHPGGEAFKKVNFEHQRVTGSVGKLDLPPEPFIIVDAPTSAMANYRRMFLYVIVFCLSVGLFMFLRHPKFRRICRIL